MEYRDPCGVPTRRHSKQNGQGESIEVSIVTAGTWRQIIRNLRESVMQMTTANE